MLSQNCHMMKKVFSKHCPQVLWPRFYPKDKYLSLLLRVNHVRIILQGKINPHLHHQEIKEGHLTQSLPVLVIKEKGGLTVEALVGKEPIIAIMIEGRRHQEDWRTNRERSSGSTRLSTNGRY